jgi:hypothetical protein
MNYVQIEPHSTNVSVFQSINHPRVSNSTVQKKGKKNTRNEVEPNGSNLSMVLVMSNMVHKRNGGSNRTDKIS